MSKDVMIITGAATGIGLAAAQRLCSEYFIVMTYNRTAIAPQDIAINGVAVRCDVSDYAQCERVVEEAERHGRVVSLVHSAGINSSPISVADMPVEEWNRVIHNNLTGTFCISKAVIPALRRSGGGSIVLVSSTAGRNGFSTAGGKPGMAKVHYATSKAGIIAFTKGLAKELAGENIRVNCMAPGPIDTRMLPSQAVAASVPLQRVGRPDEAAEAIAFLATKASSFTTGCTLDVCGGLYMN